MSKGFLVSLEGPEGAGKTSVLEALLPILDVYKRQVQILDEVAQGHSEIGIIYLNNQNKKGIMQRIEKLGLEVIELIPFHTHIYLREGHPLAQKEELVMEDLADLPTVRFTQEKDEYLYYSENFVDTSASSQMFNVTDRATLNGILERTDAYATGLSLIHI